MVCWFFWGWTFVSSLKRLTDLVFCPVLQPKKKKPDDFAVESDCFLPQQRTLSGWSRFDPLIMKMNNES